MTIKKIQDISDVRPLSDYVSNEKEVRAMETARDSYLRKVLKTSALTPADRSYIEDLGATIIEGDLNKLEHIIYGFADKPSYLGKITEMLHFELQCSGIEVLPTQIARMRFDEGQAQDCAIFSIELTRAKRVLSIGTDKRYGIHVFGTKTRSDQEDDLSEDPYVLMRQIGRIATLSWGMTPPPFSK